MATHASSPRSAPASRLALRTVVDRNQPYGAWWPEGRQLSEELGHLLELWPAQEGRVARVLYSPPDWDDHPRSVAVADRRIKTGSFPRDDTHQLTLSLLDGTRRTIIVIPADTSAHDAQEILDGVGGESGADDHL